MASRCLSGKNSKPEHESGFDVADPLADDRLWIFGK